MNSQCFREQALRELGWRPCWDAQFTSETQNTILPVRVTAHHGSQVHCNDGTHEFALPVQLLKSCGDLAVGDWVLLDSASRRGIRRLARTSLITRKAPGGKAEVQLIAANIDTLFIVTSCNHDFKAARLERYLALASEANVQPVVVLTKADLSDDVDEYRQEAVRLKSGLVVETVDARDPAQMASLAHWCGIGRTVALVGSSGVGKSTLAMALGARRIATQAIREDDSKGRHTTTARYLHRLSAGGILIDTPGMRELQLADCEDGVDDVFDEIVALSEQCRFRDCNHEGEPGCAVARAIENGDLDARRLKNYRKLQSEQARNAQSLHQRREASRKQGKFYKTILASKRERFG